MPLLHCPSHEVSPQKKPECINCIGDHPASSRDCPSWQKKKMNTVYCIHRWDLFHKHRMGYLWPGPSSPCIKDLHQLHLPLKQLIIALKTTPHSFPKSSHSCLRMNPPSLISHHKCILRHIGHRKIPLLQIYLLKLIFNSWDWYERCLLVEASFQLQSESGFEF